jgi:hypothetical protein
MAFDILAEDPLRTDFVDDPGNIRPEVSRIGVAETLAGIAERLAWIAGRDEMNSAAPRSAVERLKIVPDRRLCQGLVFHPGHEGRRSMGFPLDVTHSPISWLGDVDSEIETAVPGAEGNSAQLVRVEGIGGV